MQTVVPAKAGTLHVTGQRIRHTILGPRLRGDDGVVAPSSVIPAKAGIQWASKPGVTGERIRPTILDPRLRGDDE